MSWLHEVSIKDICDLITVKTNIKNASIENYISTENMLPNFGGVEHAQKLPSSNTVNTFIPQDVLFSNIRTYFKKVWFAKFNGTASADVLVFRGKDNCDSRFLYYLMCDPSFIEYTVLTSKGAKMPRGDKDAIFSYPVLLPSLKEQRAIASVLSSLDEKIDLLHRQNKTLESMAETLFRQWFILDKTGILVSIDQIIDFNPKRTLTKSQDATYLDMAGLSTVIFRANGYYRRPFSSGTKFTKRDTLLARITPCLENGKAAYIDFLDDNETGWGSTEFIVMRPKKEIHPLISYVMSRNPDFKEYAESCMEGSTGRQRVNLDHLKKFNINLPTEASLRIINDLLDSFESKLINNSKQIDSLEKIRDTLLPKLLSGEVRVQYAEEAIASVA